MSGLAAVVKVGGGLLSLPGALDRVARELGSWAGRIVVVPGGGPFADAVRRLDERLGLSPESAHWMAILAMDQYAYVLAERVPGGFVTRSPAEIGEALGRDAVPVLAPAEWIRAADPLPHGWEYAGDCVAAYVAGALDAPHLVLVKPVEGEAAGLTDPAFASVVPNGLRVSVIGAAGIARLSALLGA